MNNIQKEQITFGDKYNVRVYGRETYYSRDTYVNGTLVGQISEYHSVWKQILANPADFLCDAKA